jgi:prepilin-type N-terminal cleavage/methylation domain-containing protein
MLLPKIKKQDSGLSLVEMLVTVVIVGVLMSLAISSFVGMYNQNQLKDALRQVEASIKEAQKQAKKKGKTCKIKLDTVTIDGKIRNRVTIVKNTDPGESGKDYTGCLLSDQILPESVSLVTNIPGSTNKITFSYKGNTPTSGTIKLSATNTSSEKCLVISNGLGIIRTGQYDDTVSGRMAEKCIKI